MKSTYKVILVLVGVIALIFGVRYYYTKNFAVNNVINPASSDGALIRLLVTSDPDSYVNNFEYSFKNNHGIYQYRFSELSEHNCSSLYSYLQSLSIADRLESDCGHWFDKNSVTLSKQVAKE